MKHTVKTSIRKDQLTAGGKARIEFVIYSNKQQCRVSSGKGIEPKFWNTESGCVDRKSPDALDINRQLTEKIADFERFVKTKEFLNEKIILNDLKAVLKGQSVGKKAEIQKKKYPTLSEAFKSYVTNIALKPSTVVNYNTTEKLILEFCRKNYARGLAVNNIDFDFLERFKKYLRVERKNGKNTIAKRLKILKSVYLYADNQGYIEKNAFKGYKIEHGKPREIALSADEYSRIRQVRIPNEACNSMRITKFIFVFCCETGLRYSDAMDLRWEHIDEAMKDILKVQVKTEREVYVPISNQAKAIMIMYKNRHKDSNGYVFPRIENQVMNRHLKEIAKIAGIKKNLTTHVARHTFGTRLGATGIVSPFTICELMGHSDLTMTQRYVNLSKDDLRTTMNKVWGQKNGQPMERKIINLNTSKYETNRQSF